MFSQQPTVFISTNQDFSKSDENAGFDLHSAESVVVPPKTRMLINTDLKLDMPKYMYGKIEARSGLAKNKYIDVKAGVIDSGYKGVVGILLYNDGTEPFKVEVGDRISQLIFCYVFHPNIVKVNENELSSTSRGEKGFGSSGIN